MLSAKPMQPIHMGAHSSTTSTSPRASSDHLLLHSQSPLSLSPTSSNHDMDVHRAVVGVGALGAGIFTEPPRSKSVDNERPALLTATNRAKSSSSSDLLQVPHRDSTGKLSSEEQVGTTPLFSNLPPHILP
jgi:hypothetical protein